MNLTPSVVASIRDELSAAPRGERGREAKRLAELYGRSIATVYRAAGVGGAKRARDPARPEYRDWVRIATRIAHRPSGDRPLDEPIPLDLAVRAGVESALLPPEALDMPLATAHRIRRELGLVAGPRRTHRIHADYPMQAVLVDWSSSKYLTVVGPEEDDWLLKLHRRPWAASGYKNKPLGPDRMRLGVHGFWEMCTGFCLARYTVERGESATGVMAAVCWAFEEKDDPRLPMHGKPDDLWSDLGPLAKSSPAKDLIDRLDIHLVTGEPYHKERMGGVERGHRTRWVRFERLLFARGSETILLSGLNARLLEFLVEENARRPSRASVNGRRASRTAAWTALVRAREVPLERFPENAIETMATEKRAKIDSNGIIRWGGAEYEAGGNWHSRWVVASRAMDGKGDLAIVDEATGAKESARSYAGRAYGEIRSAPQSDLGKLLDEPFAEVAADIWAPKDVRGVAGIAAPTAPAAPLENPLDTDRIPSIDEAMQLFVSAYPHPIPPRSGRSSWSASRSRGVRAGRSSRSRPASRTFPGGPLDGHPDAQTLRPRPRGRFTDRDHGRDERRAARARRGRASSPRLDRGREGERQDVRRPGGAPRA